MKSEIALFIRGLAAFSMVAGARVGQLSVANERLDYLGGEPYHHCYPLSFKVDVQGY